jgi:hypothetical protein
LQSNHQGTWAVEQHGNDPNYTLEVFHFFLNSLIISGVEAAFRERKPWSLATRFGVAVIAFAIGIGAYWASTFRTPKSALQQPTPQQRPPQVSYENAEPATLWASIRDAKARGENTVEFGVIGCGWDVGRLSQALSTDTIVLAELVGKKTYSDTWGLRTWYRFKLKETLVEHRPPRQSGWMFERGAPSDMLPIADDEFLIEGSNGQMEIDGVTVIQHSNGARYLEDQTYLLFLWIDPSTRTAIPAGTDAHGVFLVDNEGNLRSYVDDDYPLKSDLAKRFNNSVDKMRQALKK